jgi:chorismate mutase / prephenate dehydratase
MAAFVVGRLEETPSGDDVTLLAIEAVADLSRARLKELLLAVGLDPRWLAVWREPGTAQALHLVEVDGYLDDGEARLGAALAASRNELLRLLRVGVYARPLPPAPPG